MKYGRNETVSLTFCGISGMLGAFITSPLAGEILSMEASKEKPDYSWMLIPGLIASSTATVAFVMLSKGTYFGGLYVFPDYLPKVTDLICAVPLGIVGGLVGALFIIVLHGMQRALKPLESHVVLRAILGGLGLGLAGSFLPLTLFSGEEQMSQLIAMGMELGVLMLLILALVKVAVTSLCLATGWKGGYIFPTMFAGAALGIAIHNIFPSIPMAVAVSATLAGAMVAVMKAPIFSAIFAALIFQKEEAPIIAIATVFGLLSTMPFSILSKPNKPISQDESSIHERQSARGD